MFKKLVEFVKRKKLGVSVKVSSDVIGRTDTSRIKKAKDTGVFLTFKF